MATKAVATKEDAQTGVAVFDASMFENDAGAGNDNVGQDDLALPFLKIISGLDTLLDEMEELRKGDIFNTVTSDIYKGKEGVRVIPCAYQRRFIEWAPRGQGSGAPVNIFTPEDNRPRTERSKEDNREYVVGGNGTYIEDTQQHFVMVVNDDGSAQPALIAMKSTQLKKGRKWNSIIQGRTAIGKNGPFQMPRYSNIYRLKSLAEENSKGSWHGWDVSLEGAIQDAALYMQAKVFAESISRGDVEVKHQQEQDSSNDRPSYGGGDHGNDKDIPF
jgi:hypothetical protein